jgi:hypothetical protein
VLHSAVRRYGSPEGLVTDSGSVFLANRARDSYGALGIDKHEIERGRPWQNYSETTFGIQKRMTEWHFQGAKSWTELVAAHDRFVSDNNAQAYFAHQKRGDGSRSPGEVLSWVSGMRLHPKDLERAFFSERHPRVIDASGYATLMRWRLYAEEGLAGREANLWLLESTLTVEHEGEPLSAYEVDRDPASGRGGSGRLLEVKKASLLETPPGSSFAHDPFRGGRRPCRRQACDEVRLESDNRLGPGARGGGAATYGADVRRRSPPLRDLRHGRRGGRVHTLHRPPGDRGQGGRAKTDGGWRRAS